MEPQQKAGNLPITPKGANLIKLFFIDTSTWARPHVPDKASILATYKMLNSVHTCEIRLAGKLDGINTPEATFTTLHFLHNFLISPIS